MTISNLFWFDVVGFGGGGQKKKKKKKKKLLDV
jgi:hypothetical protein